MSGRLHDATKFSERSALRDGHDAMADELRIARCRNGFTVEASCQAATRCVVTSLDELLEVVRTEFSPEPPAEPQAS